MAALKLQTIAVDVMFNARAELMEDFKKGEHRSSNPDKEIWTWKRRQVVLDGGGDESKEDEDLALVIEIPKLTEVGDSSKQSVPEVGDGDVGKEGLVEPVVSQVDITKD